VPRTNPDITAAPSVGGNRGRRYPASAVRLSKGEVDAIREVFDREEGGRVGEPAATIRWIYLDERLGLADLAAQALRYSYESAVAFPVTDLESREPARLERLYNDIYGRTPELLASVHRLKGYLERTRRESD
jgi:hypothetical protein